MPPPVARRAPYKDFLNPALQRRFAGTTAIVLGLAYLQGLTFSTWNSFIWSWFPLGLPGFRALAIFGCVLPIILLRIAHAHMGIRTSSSPFETLIHTPNVFESIETLLTYALSAWLFSQTYLFSSPQDSDLHWVIRPTGRARLNEQAVFFTVTLIVLGISQGVLHLALDRNRTVLGFVKAKSEKDGEKKQNTDHWAATLIEKAPPIVVRSGVIAITTSLTNYFVLYGFIRRYSWAWTISLFRTFYTDFPRSNLPPTGRGPWSFWMLGRTIWASYLLCLLWSFSDVALRVQSSREPLKGEQPLTNEARDPNDSLLNGLKSKKPRIHSFAMWELAFIARDFDDRRKAIFEDIDRKDGPMWSQIYVICLDKVRSLERTMDDFRKPPPPPPAADPIAAKPQERIVPPIKTMDVSTPVKGSKSAVVKDALAKFATSPGETPVDRLGPRLKKGAEYVADSLMTKEQQAALQPQVLQGQVSALAIKLLALPIIGPTFQRTFSKRLARAVIGSPYADVSVYINAAYALSRLAVRSIKEDTYGNVQRDVPSIIRTFTMVIKKLESFRTDFPVDWTDLKKDRESPEITELLLALKEDLAELINAFEQFASELRLSRADIRMAKEAAVIEKKPVAEAVGVGSKDVGRGGQQVGRDKRGPEMQQVN